MHPVFHSQAHVPGPVGLPQMVKWAEMIPGCFCSGAVFVVITVVVVVTYVQLQGNFLLPLCLLSLLYSSIHKCLLNALLCQIILGAEDNQ